MTEETPNHPSPQPISKGKKIYYAAAMVFYAAFSILLAFFIVEVGGHPHFDGIGVFVVLFLAFSVWAALAYGRGVFLPASEQKGSDKAGMQWGLLPVMGTAFLILFLSKAGSCQSCAYNSEAKSNLHDIFLSCKGYWADSGSDKNCDVDIARLTTYGYVQSEQVSISAGGTETTFSAQAQHEEGTKTFAIDANGKITEVDGKESKAR